MFLKKTYIKRFFTRPLSKQSIKNVPWKALFFGGDQFSIYSLDAVWKEYSYRDNLARFQNLEVVVNSESNLVAKYAKQKHLKIHKWPPSIEEKQFDVGLVVSFGHLIPEDIIEKFPLGMLNVHGSLLPKYRGAAPIIHALANGEKETGVSIMRLQPKQFDIGEIVDQQNVEIDPNITMPELHARLGRLGAELLVKTLRDLPSSVNNARPQPSEGVSLAPKVTPNFGKVNWTAMTATDIWNLYRALKGMYPLLTTFQSKQLKILDVTISDVDYPSKGPGSVHYDKNSKSLIVECANKTFICVNLVNFPGKKSMSATEFQNGHIKKNNQICFR